MIEQLTGRKVLAFLSQAHRARYSPIEMFLIEQARFRALAPWSSLTCQAPGAPARTAWARRPPEPKTEWVATAGWGVRWGTWVGTAIGRAFRLGTSLELRT